MTEYRYADQRIDFEPSQQFSALLDNVVQWRKDQEDIKSATSLLRRSANDILDNSSVRPYELSTGVVQRSSMPVQFRYNGVLSALQLEDHYKFDLRTHTHEGLAVRLHVLNPYPNKIDMNIFLIGSKSIKLYDGTELSKQEQIDELYEILTVIDQGQEKQSAVLGLTGMVSRWDREQTTA